MTRDDTSLMILKVPTGHCQLPSPAGLVGKTTRGHWSSAAVGVVAAGEVRMVAAVG